MRLTVLTAAAGIALLAGCSADSTRPSGGRQVTVSFQTSPTAGASSSIGSTGSVLALNSATDALVITKAELVLARLELERTSSSCQGTAAAGDDHEGDDDSCRELELKPRVVTLPVEGTVANALRVDIPDGTYKSLEAKIRAIKSQQNGNGSRAFLDSNPDLFGVSVRVTGTFNGKAFTYLGAPTMEFETSFDPPIVVDSGGVNITIHVDLASWFKNAAGALIDPATANLGGVNSGLVEMNIRRSFKAFRDDDHDGREDHDRHSEHHDHGGQGDG